MIEFKSLGYEDIDAVSEMFTRDNRNRKEKEWDITCDHVFWTSFLWRDYYNTKYSIIEDSLVLQINCGGLEMYSSPIGGSNIQEVFRKLKMYSHSSGKGMYFCFVPEEDLPYYDDVYSVVFPSEEPDWYDYVYDKVSLTEYNGRRYHGQKNFLNRYLKNNRSHEFIPITSENIFEVSQYAKEWYSKHSDVTDMSAAEERSIYDILNNWNKATGLSGGYITSDKGISGFTIGEVVNDTVYIHIEKAEHSIPGAYQFLSSEYLKRMIDNSIRFVNREEDMGIDGIRKAKQSLHPVKMLKKYTLYCC